MSGKSPPDEQPSKPEETTRKVSAAAMEKIDNAISNVVTTLAKNESPSSSEKEKKKSLWSAGTCDDGYSSYTSTPKSVDHKSCGESHPDKTSNCPTVLSSSPCPRTQLTEEVRIRKKGRPGARKPISSFLLSDLLLIWLTCEIPLCYRNGGAHTVFKSQKTVQSYEAEGKNFYECQWASLSIRFCSYRQKISEVLDNRKKLKRCSDLILKIRKLH
ncbi:transporter [Caerostris extrusa]|uniref:Transporter n=1 Tax=Caerostris extrusa TaxID=172846 RepID=A0AAV4RDJ0_CAEEX|nr:transporter [Caerostris extrusa]